MKKAVRVTMKKVQKIFDRRKSKNTGDGNSMTRSSEDGSCRSTQIEDGLEVDEDQPTFSPGNSTESSPEPLEIFQSSGDENFDYIARPRETYRRARTREVKQNKTSGPVIVRHNGDQEGACGPLVKDYKNEEQQVVPYIRVPEVPSCRSVALTSCGDLEKTCSELPLELQVKISVIKENLLRQYPPFYDFCIIASDDDYDEAARFKQYVASSFGLAGCTLDDGFIPLGADLFDCYKMMMDQSTKVFFFVTENFTSSAFCKRLQSGAVFQSLMSKAQKDKEKCVPVFPHGFCMAPLALSGIAGLNPTQRDVTRRSLDNTYSPLLRNRRLVWDQENFKRRCISFQVEVMKCIEEAESERKTANALQNELSITSLPVNSIREEENVPAVEALPSPSPVIAMENENEACRKNVDRCHEIESQGNIKSVQKVKNGECKEDKSSRLEDTFPKKRVSVENEKLNAKNVKCENQKTEDANDLDDDEEDGLFKGLPDEIRKVLKEENSMSAVMNDCHTVHIGNTYHITINPTPTDISNLEQHINSKSAAFMGKKMPEYHSDSSD